jgi:DNA-binding NtrC family response regulator
MGQDTTKSVATSAHGMVLRWRIDVSRGRAKGQSKVFAAGLVRVGSASSNDIVLDDSKVSRHHLLLEIRPQGLRARDLGSKNGTFFQRSRIAVVDLPVGGAVLKLGETELTLMPDDEPVSLVPSTRERCGRLLGRSVTMRLLFTQIERLAPTTATVLVHGETGTGKELVAEALHDLSRRRERPFVVVDCGSIPRDLVESELFGHVRGAFTGATTDRRGAFELAHEGTVFLDEIGELPLDLQPRLLRVLETGQVKPVGAERTVATDVRVIAASLRDLAAEVREGRFRDDLFFRLSVVRLDVPALRERSEDVAMLVDHFLSELGARTLTADSMALLSSYGWPGNVRQLRNVIERAAALAGEGPLVVRSEDLELEKEQAAAHGVLNLPYKTAKDEVIARFTKEYLEALLARSGGNVSAAAREAKVDRNWIVALARRHGVRVRD